MAFVTRFAPSPTGPLHLGHAYSAILAHDMAKAVGGRFLLRIEDIDRARARPEWEAQIYDDLTWLGLHWETPALRQSDQLSSYKTALQTLWQGGVLYPCSCNRRDIEAALNAPQEGDSLPRGPDGLIYPRTCRPQPVRAPTGPMPEDAALRLNLSALETFGFPKGWSTLFTETGPEHAGQITTKAAQYHRQIGDILLARRDMGTSYHLSVVLDDAAQGVTQITRGADLFEATRIHVLLQQLLGLPIPRYHHHRLIRDEAGKRLAKRDDARALAKFRAEGATPADIRRLVGL